MNYFTSNTYEMKREIVTIHSQNESTEKID